MFRYPTRKQSLKILVKVLPVGFTGPIEVLYCPLLYVYLYTPRNFFW